MDYLPVKSVNLLSKTFLSWPGNPENTKNADTGNFILTKAKSNTTCAVVKLELELVKQIGITVYSGFS